jgi:hypothetical protein
VRYGVYDRKTNSPSLFSGGPTTPRELSKALGRTPLQLRGLILGVAMLIEYELCKLDEICGAGLYGIKYLSGLGE